jgi:hypothetical protein
LRSETESKAAAASPHLVACGSGNTFYHLIPATLDGITFFKSLPSPFSNQML